MHAVLASDRREPSLGQWGKAGGGGGGGVCFGSVAKGGVGGESALRQGVDVTGGQLDFTPL